MHTHFLPQAPGHATAMAFHMRIKRLILSEFYMEVCWKHGAGFEGDYETNTKSVNYKQHVVSALNSVCAIQRRIGLNNVKRRAAYPTIDVVAFEPNYDKIRCNSATLRQLTLPINEMMHRGRLLRDTSSVVVCIVTLTYVAIFCGTTRLSSVLLARIRRTVKHNEHMLILWA